MKFNYLENYVNILSTIPWTNVFSIGQIFGD